MSTVQPILAPAAAASSGFSVTAGCARPRAHFVRMFKPRFAAMVENGTKLQTVRPTPKRMPQPGDTISLRCWTGLPYRSKQRVLREAEIRDVREIYICDEGICLYEIGGGAGWAPGEHGIAKADGFESWPEMREWFRETHGLPFDGIIIFWHNACDELRPGARSAEGR